jgi:hypothetical protein
MANRFEQTNRFVDSTKQASKIRTCVRLIQKIQDDFIPWKCMNFGKLK